MGGTQGHGGTTIGFEIEDDAGESALAALGAQLVARESERETQQAMERARVDSRRKSAADAHRQLAAIMADLWLAICRVAPTTEVFSEQQLQLEGGTLEWGVAHEYVADGAFPQSGWDVLAGAFIRVQQRDSSDYPGMSASLWFVKLPGRAEHVWTEVFYVAEEGNAPSEEPFALKDTLKADRVASDTTHNVQLAAPPLTLEPQQLDRFRNRWMGTLAGAAQGKLTRPVPPSQRADDQAAAPGAFGGRLDLTPTPSRSKNPIMDRLRDLRDQ